MGEKLELLIGTLHIKNIGRNETSHKRQIWKLSQFVCLSRKYLMSTYYVQGTVLVKVIGKDKHSPKIYYSLEEETDMHQIVMQINVKLEMR